METDKRSIWKILGIIVFTVFLFWGLNNYKVLFGVLSAVWALIFPFILGGCIAFVLNTPMKAVERLLRSFGKKSNGVYLNKLCRPLSLVLTYLLFFSIITLLLFTVIPEIANSFGGLINNIQNFLLDAEDKIQKFTNLSLEWINKQISLDWNDVWGFLQGWLTEGAGSVVSSTIGATTAAVGTLVNLVLGFVFSIYVLLQKEKLSLQCKKLAYAFFKKEKAARLIEIVQLTNKTFANFLTGQCLEAVILGVLFFITMSILRFPYTMIISVLIAFTALIPIFGAFIGCAVGMFLIVVVSPIKALWFLVLFLVIQQLEGNLIYPRVVGNSVGLPSIWVLVAVTIGGNMMGIAGMLIFIPLFSILYTLLRGYVNKRLRDKKIRL